MDGSNMPHQRRNRSVLAKTMPSRIKSVSRALGYCLLLDDPDSWLNLPTILRARLSDTERATLAYVGLRALDPHQGQLAADAALAPQCGSTAGQPIASLFNHMDEAAFWADMAAPGEHEAYCLASFKAMPRGRQAAFLDYVQGRQVA